jgi:hypothetical protein
MSTNFSYLVSKERAIFSGILVLLATATSYNVQPAQAGTQNFGKVDASYQAQTGCFGTTNTYTCPQNNHSIDNSNGQASGFGIDANSGGGPDASHLTTFGKVVSSCAKASGC